MTRLRPLLAALVFAVPLLLVPLAARAAWDAGWDIGYMNGRCWARLCVVTGTPGAPYAEVSWSEYDPPLPATVPVGGAPAWGAPPISSANGSSTGP